MRHFFSKNHISKIGIKYSITANVILLSLMSGYSQDIDSKISSDLTSPFELAKGIYHEKIGSSARIHNGLLYSDRYPGIKGHQFYSSDYWIQGSICYLGLRYDDIQLKYDILNDKVIVGNYVEQNRLVGIEINKDNIEWFRLGESIFVNANNDDGIYESVYSGKSQLFIKRKKIIGQALNASGKYESFFSRDKFYIQTKNQLFEISKAKSIFEVYPEYRELIRQHRRSLGFVFKNNEEKFLVEMIKYVDSLSK